MTDDFEEDVPYVVGRTEGDIKRYWKNKPLADQYGNKAAAEWPETVLHITSELEPGFGFVAVLHTNGPLPDAHAAGFEIRDATVQVITKPPLPSDKPKTTTVAAPASAPKGGTTKRVWELAEGVYEQSADQSDWKTIRAAIIAACEAEGINKSTAGTQYSKWKRAKST